MPSRLLGFGATMLGHLTRMTIRYGAGLTGATAISVGIGLYDFRWGLITAGLALIFLDGKAR